MRGRAVRVLAVVSMVVTAMSCGNAPTQPGPPVQVVASASVIGQWRGVFEMTHCDGRVSDCDGPASQEFQLHLVPSGVDVEGVLVLLDEDRTTVNLTGRTTSNGYRFEARGYDGTPTSQGPVATVVSAIELRVDPSTGLSGSMTYTNTRSRTVTRTIAIRSAVRQAATEMPGRFQGTWQGSYRTLSCSGECSVGAGGYNHPQAGSVTLTLSQVGGDVVGVVMSHLVTGTASPTRLSVTGQPLTAELCSVCWDCDGQCQTAVRDLTASIDKLGRLTGTFEYSIKGWTGRDHFRQVMRVELVGVTRRW